MNIPLLLKALTNAGRKACLAHPDAKLYASVNHDDNFALSMGSTIQDAMMDVIIERVDAKDRTCIEWFNKESNRQFKQMAMAIGKECWTILRK